MSSKSKKIAGDASKSPDGFYKNPEAVLSDGHLTSAEKDRVLHDWEQDELALLRAEEENMSPKWNADAPEDVLIRIKKAERVFSKTDKTPTKQ